MPERHPAAAVPGRAFWSGTITFGLVSVPVDLFAAVRPRETAMKMVDADGRPLGRRYYCSRDGQPLDPDDLVRGYETASGQMVVVTDEELDALAPDKSRDIDLRQFVPREQIPATFFDRSYFLLPAGRSTKAYHLLAAIMQRAGRAGIATLVMRDKEYLVAIVAEGGVLRAETLRFASELRSPRDVGLPAAARPAAATVKKFERAIADLARDGLDPRDVADWYADAIEQLAERKRRKRQDVVERAEGAEDDDEEEAAPSADVVDLMKVIKERLAKNASVKSAADGGGSGRKARSAPRPSRRGKRARGPGTDKAKKAA